MAALLLSTAARGSDSPGPGGSISKTGSFDYPPVVARGESGPRYHRRALLLEGFRVFESVATASETVAEISIRIAYFVLGDLKVEGLEDLAAGSPGVARPGPW